MRDWWNSLSRETFAQTLAFIIVGTWLAMIFLHVPTDQNQTLTAVVMLVIGYFYGSSTGSKRKDDALMPPAMDRGATTTETKTTMTAATADKPHDQPQT